MRCSNRDSCTVLVLKFISVGLAKTKSGIRMPQKPNSDATSAFSPPHRRSLRDYPQMDNAMFESRFYHCYGRHHAKIAVRVAIVHFERLSASPVFGILGILRYYPPQIIWEIIRHFGFEKLSARSVLWKIIRHPRFEIQKCKNGWISRISSVKSWI